MERMNESIHFIERSVPVIEGFSEDRIGQRIVKWNILGLESFEGIAGGFSDNVRPLTQRLSQFDGEWTQRSDGFAQTNGRGIVLVGGVEGDVVDFDESTSFFIVVPFVSRFVERSQDLDEPIGNDLLSLNTGFEKEGP